MTFTVMTKIPRYLLIYYRISIIYIHVYIVLYIILYNIYRGVKMVDLSFFFCIWKLDFVTFFASILLDCHPYSFFNKIAERSEIIINKNSIWIGYKLQNLLTKSYNLHALEMEAEPHHMTFTLHHVDFLWNCDTIA